jgi:RNA polymerase sigma-70 factor (ECF subfamily)
VTAAVTAQVRIPGQAGPPAAELDQGPHDRRKLVRAAQAGDQRPAAEVDQGTHDRWQLVRAAQAGDRAAFGQLYAYYQPMVQKFIARKTANPMLAEDLTSDVFVRALRSIESVTWQGRDFGAWLTTVARNLVMDYFKSGRYRMELLAGDDAVRSDRADNSPEGHPDRTVVDHLTNLELLAAVQHLTAEQRECIRLRFLLGLSVIETAHAMGKQEGAVKALQYRAVRSLAQLLPPGMGHPC